MVVVRKAVSARRALVVYSALLAASAAVVLFVHRVGASLAAPFPAASAVASTGSGGNVIVHVLFALAVVVAVGHVMGRLLSAIGQPPVIGEVLGGIVVGPSVLGRVWPEAVAFILPPAAVPSLAMISQLGVALYMFVVGLSLDLGRIRHKAGAAVAISNAGIVTPFVLGSILALYLFPRFATADVSFTSFALFSGVAMSITAFPVLARILTDNGMSRTEVGSIALTCAAADDVTAWCLLAFVVGVVRASVQDALVVSLLTAVFVAGMFLVARPLIHRVVAKLDGAAIGRGTIAVTLVALLLSMLVTEAIGVHLIFGAFLLGALIPHESGLARALTTRMEDLVSILFLPAFFSLTGMRTQVGLVETGAEWAAVALIILVATVGKFGGSAVAARLSGLGWRQSAILGALMNTRGLMELIVLNIGLELGVISPTLFTMMVLMALVTTIMTTPLMRLVRGGEQQETALRAS
jgi:Kef-type K+ transport system membrane component KefB